MPFTTVHAGKYRTEDKTIQKLNTTKEKVNNVKHSKTKLLWFSRVLQHSARKRGELNQALPERIIYSTTILHRPLDIKPIIIITTATENCSHRLTLSSVLSSHSLTALSDHNVHHYWIDHCMVSRRTSTTSHLCWRHTISVTELMIVEWRNLTRTDIQRYESNYRVSTKI